MIQRPPIRGRGRPKKATPPVRQRRALTLVELLVAIAIIAILVSLLVPAVQQARAAAARLQCANNLKQLGLAAHHYHDDYAALPPGVTSNQPGEPFARMTWLTRLLPNLEQGPLWRITVAAYDYQPVPFVNPPHISFGTPITLFACPADGRVLQAQPTHKNYLAALTSYVGVLGLAYDDTAGVLYRDSRTRLTDITDGTSNTLLAGERPPSADCWYGWWYAGYGQAGTGSADMLLGVRERNSAGRTSRLAHRARTIFNQAGVITNVTSSISGVCTRAGRTSSLRTAPCIFCPTAQTLCSPRWRPARALKSRKCRSRGCRLTRSVFFFNSRRGRATWVKFARCTRRSGQRMPGRSGVCLPGPSSFDHPILESAMSMMMMERAGMAMPAMSTGMGTMGSPAGTMPNMMMVPRCTMKMEKTKTGMTMTCTCDDAMAANMMKNLCSMLTGSMVSCCMMMNGMMVCSCNMTMGMTSCEMTDKGCKIMCTSGDAKCCQMIQACCDCMTAMMQSGCTCCVMMNNMPVCCGCA